MNRTPKIMLMSGLLLSSPIAHAENPLDCVDTDVVNTLLEYPGQGSVQVSRQLPQKFPRLSFPTGFSLIGSRSTPYFSIVAFKSTLPVAATRKAVESALSDENWKRYNMPDLGMAGGFQSSRVTPVRDAISFCHTKYGHMKATFSTAPKKAIYVALTGSPQRSGDQCNMREQSVMLSRFGATAKKMPTLSLPENSTSTEIGGISSSGDNASTSIQLETKLSSADLVAFFGAQLAEQEWAEETRWSGQKVSGSVWTAEDEEDSAVLRVITLDDNQYKLDFQLTRLR